MCNKEGKKLSKRDFGFSLRDLKQAGYLPEAILNYLAIIGSSYAQEIMTLPELAHTLNFDNPQTTGHIRYDVEKLNWVNKQWIVRTEPVLLAQRCRPYLQKVYPDKITSMDDTILAGLLQAIKTDMTTIKDSVTALAFYFARPTISAADMQPCIPSEYTQAIATIITDNLTTIADPTTTVSNLKQHAPDHGVPVKHLFCFVRLALMGSTKGPGIHELVEILGTQEATERLQHALELLRTLL